MSTTFDGKSTVAAHTPPLVPVSEVSSSTLAKGSQAEPSMSGNGLPSTSLSAISVT